MIPFSKQTNKWLLSTLLVAALGSQYYFSISSVSMGSAEMSSNALQIYDQKVKEVAAADGVISEELESRTKELIVEHLPEILTEEFATKNKAIDASKSTAAEKASMKASLNKEYAPKIAAAKADKAKLVVATPAKAIVVASASTAVGTSTPSVKDTEAKSINVTIAGCPTCGTGVTMTGPEASITAIEAVLRKATSPTVAAPAVAEVTAPETAADRRERERTEREERKDAVAKRKQDIKDAKEERKNKIADKKREDKEDRNDRFAEDAESIADRCQDDLSCKVSRFSSLMQKYSKTKNVDQFAVTKAYNQLIDKDLKAGLRGADGSAGKSAALDAIDEMMSSIPSEYRSLKTRTVDTVKLAQVSQATEINALYKQADVYAKQNKPAESLTTRNEAFRADGVFRKDADEIYHSIYEGLTSANDQSTLDYVTKNYVADMKTIMARLTNTTAGITDAATTSATVSGGRGGRSGNNTTVSTSASGSLTGVSFGSPAVNRTSTRTGVNFK